MKYGQQVLRKGQSEVKMTSVYLLSEMSALRNRVPGSSHQGLMAGIFPARISGTVLSIQPDRD